MPYEYQLYSVNLYPPKFHNYLQIYLGVILLNWNQVRFLTELHNCKE